MRTGDQPRDHSEPAPVVVPIDWELDLHTFQPRDIPELIPAWLEACAAKGIRTVRIIHGKGTGTLRATVHALLQRSPLVHSFRPGDETTGGWGATLATLKPPAAS